MAVSRVQFVNENFYQFIKNWKKEVQPSNPKAPIYPGTNLTGEVALELFESQVTSRWIDFEARHLKEKNLGFYTIGSAGHEGNVVLGKLLRHTDPCILHYRSGALMIERAKWVSSQNPILDTFLSICASSDDPIAGGRHKVWGSKTLWVPPQTSTIASHLPKAVGMALAIERANHLKLSLPIPDDSIVCCSFGDATVNHSSALGAFNASQWAAFQHLPLPILFVCEDNDIGISVRTPKGWIEANLKGRVGIQYIQADGLNLSETYDGALEAIAWCRKKRTPVFLHLKMVRLMGHAGSDVESEYLSPDEIEEFESRDPLIKTASLLLENFVAAPKKILEIYEKVKQEVEEASGVASKKPKLKSAQDVMSCLAPYHPDDVHKEAIRKDYSKMRVQAFGGTENLPEHHPKPRHLAMLLNWALADLLAKYPQMLVFGEDVAKKGGVYHVTTDLYQRFGAARVFNTLLDEQTILGLAIGAAHLGFLPVPEIQYLAYYHNAQDQIRGEAGSLQFFSKGQFRNPMVVRIASLAYQKGFGGHFHNDNSIGALRDVPGIVIAVPARGDDGVEMLREAMALAYVDGRVVLFLEPIALYMTKDLYEEGDGLWQCKFPEPGTAIKLGEGKVYEPDGQDLTIITYANGLYLSLRAAKTLKDKHGIKARILDLRWLAPLAEEQILEEAQNTGKVLVVDECRRTGGIAEAILALLFENEKTRTVEVARINAKDTYIPLGPSANTVLPSEEDIVKAALILCK